MYLIDLVNIYRLSIPLYNLCTDHYHHHHYHPLTTAVDGTFVEISSQTPQFTIAVLRSQVSSTESLAITSGYVSLCKCTLPTGHQRMRDEIT